MEIADECGNLQIPMYNDDRQDRVLLWAGDKCHTFVASVENVLSIFVVISESDYLYITCHNMWIKVGQCWILNSLNVTFL